MESGRRSLLSRLTDLSRVVSHVLRHDPGRLNLTLDKQGWVDLSDLVAALRRQTEWADVTADEIDAMISASVKLRHEISGERIRARYGHSVQGDFHWEPAAPPDELYHGTSPQAAAQILQSGLVPRSRQFVHLSRNPQMAVAVGSRRSPRPVVLVVAARQAAHQGIVFHVADDEVWLSGPIPPRFIRRSGWSKGDGEQR